MCEWPLSKNFSQLTLYWGSIEEDLPCPWSPSLQQVPWVVSGVQKIKTERQHKHTETLTSKEYMQTFTKSFVDAQFKYVTYKGLFQLAVRQFYRPKKGSIF